MIRMKKTGWKGARDWLKQVTRSLQVEAAAMLAEIAEHTALQLRSDIEIQARPWAPLNAAYLAWKIFSGLDPRILVATKFYLNHVGAFQLDRWEWMAGWLEETHPPSGFLISKLWELLEYGSHVMPARPHVKPVADDASRDIPKFIRGYGFVYLGKVP